MFKRLALTPSNKPAPVKNGFVVVLTNPLYKNPTFLGPYGPSKLAEAVVHPDRGQANTAKTRYGAKYHGWTATDVWELRNGKLQRPSKTAASGSAAWNALSKGDQVKVLDVLEDQRGFSADQAGKWADTATKQDLQRALAESEDD